MEPFSISSGVAGLISLGITVCHGLLDYYSSWEHAEGNVLQMYTSIQALTKTLKLLESALQHESFDQNVASRVEDCITSVERGLLKLQKKLDKIRLVPLGDGWKSKTKAQYHRTLFPFKESTLAKLKELSNDLRDELSLALDVLQVDASAVTLHKLDLVSRTLTDVSTSVGILKDQSVTMSEKVKEIQTSSVETSGSVNDLALAQNKDHKRKVYEWLSPLTAEFHRKQLDTFNIPNRQTGTAQRFLGTSEFKHWISCTGETLWCPGIPGTGKTVLTCSIISHMQNIVDQREHRLAYIYLNYKDTESQTAPNLLLSIISQLASLESSCPEELIACYHSHGSGASRPSQNECRQLLRSIISRCAKVSLIIDAFDECSEECRSVLLKELRCFQPKMNMLITSRDLPNVGSRLGKLTRLRVQASRDDIVSYIQERISQSERIQCHARKDKGLCDLISTTIAAKVGEMFLQARLHLDSLEATTTLRKLKEAVRSLPKELNKTYDETFERVHAQHPDQANLARKALYWVFNASRNLTMPELQHALAVEPRDRNLDEDNIPDEGLLLSVCNGLIIHHKESDLLSLVHNTLQEYMVLNANTMYPEAEEEMATTSLTYLLFDEFEQGPCCDDYDFEARLYRWPLLRYAASNWGQHARYPAEDHCKDLIQSFLCQKAKMLATVQVLYDQKSLWGPGFSQNFPREIHAIWLASFYGLEDTVAWLLNEDKSSVLSQTTWGDTALHGAVICGHLRIVRLLLSHGANARARDRSGNTPLHVATLVRIEMSAHSNYNPALPDDRFCMLQRFQSEENPHALELELLNRGADVHAVNHRGQSSLHLAVSDGDESLSQLLLDKGADVCLEDHAGWQPLSLAVEYGLIDVAQFLLNYNLQRQIHLGILDDALFKAVHNNRLPLLKILISKSPKAPSEDPEGRSLLHVCSFQGSLECFQYLAQLGFHVRAQDKRRRTCLHHAMAGGWRAIELLLTRGLDPEQPDIDGWTPLYWAAKSGSNTNVHRLLDLNGLPQDSKAWMPYAIAMFHSKPDVAALLVPPGQTAPNVLGGQQIRTLFHRNINCDGCDSRIWGTRYKCAVCADFDYCFKCFRAAKITHPRHSFKSIYWGDEKAAETDTAEAIQQLQTLEAMMMGEVPLM